jgi:hypothetical protein
MAKWKAKISSSLALRTTNIKKTHEELELQNKSFSRCFKKAKEKKVKA